MCFPKPPNVVASEQDILDPVYIVIEHLPLVIKFNLIPGVNRAYGCMG